MLRGREIVLIALLTSAVWVVVVALQSDPSAYQKICETDHYTGQEKCSAHNVLYVIAWYAGEGLNYVAPALTAFATIAIAWFTLILKRSTDRLWRAGKKQFRLASDEFIATHRPIIRVRRINLQGNRNDFSSFSVRLANVGETDATIEQIGSGLARKENGAWRGDEPPEPGGSNTIRPNRFIAVGTWQDFLLVGRVDPEAAAAIRGRTHELYVVGEVAYSDNKTGIVRNTGFCWIYDHRTRDFRRSKDDEEYNYED
jgi:hypothetical protein